MSIEEYIKQNPEFKEKYESLTDQEKQQLSKAAKAVSRMYESLLYTINSIAKVVGEFCKKFISYYPNKRVVYLAKHSKKKRVRKKNITRIKRDIKRMAKNARRADK